MESSDITSTQETVLGLLNISTKSKTPKGWIMGGTCPVCGKSDKFGVKLNDRLGEYKNHVTINCFHGSCEVSGSEKKLFKLLGREDLITEYEYREDFGTLTRLQIKKKPEERVPEELKKRYPPIGYRRMYSDDYLESRGFDEESFKRYSVGRSKIETKLKNYIIFLVYEDEVNRGFVARIDYTAEELREANDKRSAEGFRPLPKYKNEGGVEFSEMIYGIDEISEKTHTVILVEGILDKTNIDKELRLYNEEEIKCGCTFGKKISFEQIYKLKAKGVRKIILMYDPDAIDSIKNYSYQLMLEFEEVLVGNIVGEKDPGDMNAKEMLEVLTNLESVLSYRINSIKKINHNK